MKLPFRPKDSNKATYGNVLNIAGSLNYRGAAYLSSVSALRVGSGYVTLAAISPVIESVSAQMPDAVFLPLPQTGPVLSKAAVPIIGNILKPSSVCSFGCGISAIGTPLGELTETVGQILHLFIRQKTLCVLDADALNAISRSDETFQFDGRAIMTPHPGELSRLLHTNVEDIQKNRIDAAREASQKFKAIVLLKGYRTIIANGNTYHINTNGNSALAKAGSGDCLTGIIAGLLAQKMEPFDAGILGAKLHGIAGEMASAELSEYGVLASDLPRYVPQAIKKIQSEEIN